MSRIFLLLLFAPLFASYIPSPVPGGAAGGDLSGLYPDPAAARVEGSTVPASASAAASNASRQLIAGTTIGSGSVLLTNNFPPATFLIGSGSSIGGTAGTFYLPLGGTLIRESTEAIVSITAVSGAIINNLQVQSPTVQSSSSITVTLRQNGLSTVLTCGIAATGTNCSDLTDAVTVAAGDTLDYQWVVSGSGSIGGDAIIAVKFGVH